MDSISERKHINPVAAILQQEIERAGVITFARFMEHALYHPEHGYYFQDQTVIGKSGDFFTSVSVGSLFGEMLAFWLQRESPNAEHIVEAAANDGSLARDILSAWPGAIEYWIVEPNERLQARQRKTLAHFPNVKWAKSLDELPAIRGAFISNELLDAFPAHVFQWNGAWREMGVDATFAWREMEKLPDWAEECLRDLNPLEPHLPLGYRVEFSPAAENWWRTAAQKLETGLMLAIDYGDEAHGLWTPGRSHGTLRSFRNHRLVDNPLADPGAQDITLSVNFSRIRRAGEAGGLTSEPLLTQATYLSRIARDFFANAPDANRVRQFQTLTHPDHLGRAFKVCVQRRG